MEPIGSAPESPEKPTLETEMGDSAEFGGGELAYKKATSLSLYGHLHGMTTVLPWEKEERRRKRGGES